MVTTDAWVLYKGDSENPDIAELEREAYSFPDITDYEVLAEPIYGCWEANMTHSLERSPLDICHHRREEKVVIGNAGVVRILKTGSSVTNVSEGDLCGVAAIGTWDNSGFLIKVLGYDAANMMGILAKQVKLHEKQVVPLLKNTRFSFPQWAAFSLRYATAWANWKVAYGCWRQQMMDDDCPSPFVFGWGGGVALAELALAKYFGCRAAMIASDDNRLALIKRLGIHPIDRRQFMDLNFDEEKYRSDRDYKKRYIRAEKTFLNTVKDITQDNGVSIFIDNIGTPVFRATLKALSNQGVTTTCGWRNGMMISFNRAVECLSRHIHVHTHGCKYSEGVKAMHFAEETGWMAPIDDKIYGWDEIPQLANDYAEGKIDSYFPIFQVNPL